MDRKGRSDEVSGGNEFPAFQRHVPQPPDAAPVGPGAACAVSSKAGLWLPTSKF